MSRYIDADKIKEVIDNIETLTKEKCPAAVYAFCAGVRKTLEYIPTADVEPITRGNWTQPDELAKQLGVYVCSVCGDAVSPVEDYGIDLMVYCPHCGARMIEEEKTDE